MTSFKVIYDANVLYPAPLRDLLMWVALQDVVLARWTDEIHDEWIRNVLQNRPDIKPEQLQRTRELMNAHVRDCLVTGYEPLIPGLKLPDEKDRHVLAAAIKAGASVISPPKTVAQLLDTLASQQLPMFVERLRAFQELL